MPGSINGLIGSEVLIGPIINSIKNCIIGIVNYALNDGIVNDIRRNENVSKSKILSDKISET